VDLDVFALLFGVVAAAAPHDGILVASGAPDGVEEGPQTVLGSERDLEHGTAALEQHELIGGQVGHRAPSGCKRDQHRRGRRQWRGRGRGGGSGRGVIAGGDGADDRREYGDAGAAVRGHSVLPGTGSRAPQRRGRDSGGKRTLGQAGLAHC
jgi:hypothetical protein